MEAYRQREITGSLRFETRLKISVSRKLEMKK